MIQAGKYAPPCHGGKSPKVSSMALKFLRDRTVKCLLAEGVKLGGYPSRSTAWHEGSGIWGWNGSGGNGWRGGERVG